jgi:hypothetical protein
VLSCTKFLILKSQQDLEEPTKDSRYALIDCDTKIGENKQADKVPASFLESINEGFIAAPESCKNNSENDLAKFVFKQLNKLADSKDCKKEFAEKVEAEQKKRANTTKARLLTGTCAGLACGFIDGARRSAGYSLTSHSWIDSALLPAAAFIGAYILNSAESRGSRLLLSLVTSLSCIGGAILPTMLFTEKGEEHTRRKAIPNSNKHNKPSHEKSHRWGLPLFKCPV